MAGTWIDGQFSVGLMYTGKFGQIQKALYSLWKRKIANPIWKIDDYVKQIFREHNQEADHCVNLEAEGQRKIIMDKGKMLKYGRR